MIKQTSEEVYAEFYFIFNFLKCQYIYSYSKKASESGLKTGKKFASDFFWYIIGKIIFYFSIKTNDTSTSQYYAVHLRKHPY
jgi:hypothetical protein